MVFVTWGLYGGTEHYAVRRCHSVCMEIIFTHAGVYMCMHAWMDTWSLDATSTFMRYLCVVHVYPWYQTRSHAPMYICYTFWIYGQVKVHNETINVASA